MIKQDNDFADDFRLMCRYFCSLMEGDDYMIEPAYALMRKYGIVDADGFPIEEEEDD